MTAFSWIRVALLVAYSRLSGLAVAHDGWWVKPLLVLVAPIFGIIKAFVVTYDRIGERQRA